MSGPVEGGGEGALWKQNEACKMLNVVDLSSSNLIRFNLGNSVATPTASQFLQLSWARQKIPKFWFNFFCVGGSMEGVVIPLGEMSVTRMPFKLALIFI